MSTYDSQTGRLSPQVLLQQRYMIIRQAGKGGMGAVYEAMDTHYSQRRVAIKEMSQGHLNDKELANATAQFQQEARLLGSLSHPNLPRIFDAFNERGRSYLVMDFIDGQTLHQLLRSQPGKILPLEQIIQYACQLCNVLSYLHQRQPPIIFRDVKPSNVMITEKGHVYLIDFGIARIFTEGKEQDTIQLGSPGYAPPEQHGSSQTNPRSDIYSLGATLHYCLTGRDPYYSQEHFKFTPVRQLNSQVPVEMERLIQRMVAIDERQRPASANEVLQTLQSLSQLATDHTVAIQSDHDAPTLYEPPLPPGALPPSGTRPQPVTLPPGARSQPVTLPQPGTRSPYTALPAAPTIPYQAGQQQVAATIAQTMSALSSFWSARFTFMFRLIALAGIIVVGIVMGLIVLGENAMGSYPYGYAWLLGACLAGISCLVTFASFLWSKQGLGWFLLLLTGLFTLISTFCTLALTFKDIQDALALNNALLGLAFVSPLSLALAALCSLGWMLSVSTWNVRGFLLSLAVITLICMFSAAITVSRVNPLDQETIPWYLFFLVGAIAQLLNTVLVARISHLTTKLPENPASVGTGSI